MATFNGEKHIYTQVKSILDQLSTEDELIISDDGSIDDTIQIIKSFSDDRIKIFHNKAKKGPVGNFENAIINANGELIFLADQDDIWFPDKIEKHLQLHKFYDLVISDAVVIDDQGLVLHQSFFKARGSKAGLFNNLKRNTYIGCCMSFNRQIVKNALPFPRYIHMHDWWIGLVAELKGKVIFCDDKLMKYVRHQNNASPTLANSGYSFITRLENRLNLIFGLFFILIKK
ncbi:MAG: glycosyltransferase family 2 protein [Mucilaginibacter sp.]